MGKKVNLVNYFNELPSVVSAVVTDFKGDFLTTATIDNPYPKQQKVIVNEGARLVKVILLDGENAVGIARCNPEDQFDAQIGYNIAYQRAMLSYFKKSLKNTMRSMSK